MPKKNYVILRDTAYGKSLKKKSFSTLNYETVSYIRKGRKIIINTRGISQTRARNFNCYLYYCNNSPYGNSNNTGTNYEC
jgi:hypothetical protein